MQNTQYQKVHKFPSIKVLCLQNDFLSFLFGWDDRPQQQPVKQVSISQLNYTIFHSVQSHFRCRVRLLVCSTTWNMDGKEERRHFPTSNWLFLIVVCAIFSRRKAQPVKLRIFGSKVKRVNYWKNPWHQWSKSKKSWIVFVVWGDLCEVKITFHCAFGVCSNLPSLTMAGENGKHGTNFFNKLFLSQFLPRRVFNASQLNEIQGNCIDIGNKTTKKTKSYKIGRKTRRKFLKRKCEGVE